MKVITVDTPEQGIQKAAEIVYKEIDAKTILFLSGGNTPKPLYQLFVDDSVIHPAGVAMTDDRPDPKESNEIMMKEVGLLRYLQVINVPFYSILHPDSTQMGLSKSENSDVSDTQSSIRVLSELYDEKLRELFFQFHKSVGIMGIGPDGHTAGLPAGISNTKNSELVIAHDIEIMGKKGRITMTYTALAMLDKMIILAFGDNKKEALKNMDFYNQPEISPKVILITDQNIL